MKKETMLSKKDVGKIIRNGRKGDRLIIIVLGIFALFMMCTAIVDDLKTYKEELVVNSQVEGYQYRLTEIHGVVVQCQPYTYTVDVENQTMELNLILAECLQNE